jgi:hypothetical protein
MIHKAVFALGSLVIFYVLDQYWLYPFLFGNLPNPFSWALASVVAMAQLSTLFAEWIYL